MAFESSNISSPRVCRDPIAKSPPGPPYTYSLCALAFLRRPSRCPFDSDSVSILLLVVERLALMTFDSLWVDFYDSNIFFFSPDLDSE